MIPIATGSEVQIALAGRRLLAREPAAARVVPEPCVEWFTAPEPSYQEEVLPARVWARVGASADDKVLFGKFGLTAERVAEAARTSLARAARVAPPGAGGQN